jgi:hypothetical protein
MSLTKSRATITQLTAGGTSTALDISGAYRSTLYIKHFNGSGTVTTGARIQVQVQAAGGSQYYNHVGAIQASTTAAATETWTAELPDDAGSVQVVYTAPTGPTGFTLDAEVSRITAT